MTDEEVLQFEAALERGPPEGEGEQPEPDDSSMIPVTAERIGPADDSAAGAPGVYEDMTLEQLLFEVQKL